MYGRKKYIPIMAIVGFLGSGKTTLLNHILQQNQGLKIGVIVNDFGDINIDSMLVARKTDQELELSNGCICCTLEGTSLDDAIGQLAHTGSTLDYIIIEASGLAEPKELVRLLVNSKNEHARFDSLVALVDASNALETAEKHPSFMEQLSLTDILILNKLDLLKPGEKKKVREYLRFVNDKSHVLEAEFGKVETKLLLAPDSLFDQQSKQLKLGEDDDHSTHVHHIYQKFTFATSKPIDPKKWEEFCMSIPNTIYRIKGFVYFGMKGLDQKFLFQSVGGRYSLKLDEWLGAKPVTELVFIGTDFKEADLKLLLDNLIDDNPDELNNETIMDILSYR